MHYSSVGLKGAYWRTLTCRDLPSSNKLRPLPSTWDKQHTTNAWVSYIAKSYSNPKKGRIAVRPQRDEWPPQHFQQGLPIGFVRLLPGTENSGVANDKNTGWVGFCKYPPNSEIKKEGGPISYDGDTVYVTSYTSTIVTLNVLDYSFTSMSPPAGDDYGLTTNVCWPSVLTQDPGFALFTYDAYYNGNWATYSTLPITKGIKQPTYKRDFFEDDNGEIYVETEDGIRQANNEELAAEFQIKRCATTDCAAELEEQERLLELMEAGQYVPEMIVTSTTAVAEAPATVAANAVPGMMQTAVASQLTATALETREQKTVANRSRPAVKTPVVYPRRFAY